MKKLTLRQITTMHSELQRTLKCPGNVLEYNIVIKVNN